MQGFIYVRMVAENCKYRYDEGRGGELKILNFLLVLR